MSIEDFAADAPVKYHIDWDHYFRMKKRDSVFEWYRGYLGAVKHIARDPFRILECARRVQYEIRELEQFKSIADEFDYDLDEYDSRAARVLLRKFKHNLMDLCDVNFFR